MRLDVLESGLFLDIARNRKAASRHSVARVARRAAVGTPARASLCQGRERPAVKRNDEEGTPASNPF